jgi:hypothetical protein
MKLKGIAKEKILIRKTKMETSCGLMAILKNRGEAMKQYKDLDAQEKLIFERIELIFRDNPTITIKSFCRVLGVLLNKYKRVKHSA